jgi:hypothetical protein
MGSNAGWDAETHTRRVQRIANDEVDPSKVLFEPIDLVHVTRDGDHGIYIECMEYEDNIWHVRITLDVTRPSEAA